MPKVALKKAKGIEKNYSAVDVHRIIPKASGGTYEEMNYEITTPVDHMKEHGNYRERSEELDEIKSLMDDRQQVMKLTMKVQNQLLAYERNTDNLNEVTRKFLEEHLESDTTELKNRDNLLKKTIKKYSKTDELIASALGVKGIGPITVAFCLAYIDIKKARHASSLWAYAGLDKPAHERYTKGTASGGNKTLRTALYTMADSQVKTRGAYREVYDNVKHRLENSDRITTSRNTQGKQVECAWKDTKPCHRHGAALRAVMKHFLADYWYVARTMAELPTDALYPEAILGGNHRTIMPEERGWIYL